jgi:hypothetical protein
MLPRGRGRVQRDGRPEVASAETRNELYHAPEPTSGVEARGWLGLADSEAFGATYHTGVSGPLRCMAGVVECHHQARPKIGSGSARGGGWGGCHAGNTFSLSVTTRAKGGRRVAVGRYLACVVRVPLCLSIRWVCVGRQSHALAEEYFWA